VRILGIDPGSNVTGYGVIDRASGQLVHVAHGTVRFPPRQPLALRLHHLWIALSDVLEAHRPDVAVVEQVFVAASPRSALVLGQARGVALAALGSAGLPVSEYSATAIKQTVTGGGRASKQQVARMVCRTLALERTPASDAADALAAAIAHAHAGKLTLMGAGRRGSRRSLRDLAPRQGSAR